MRELTSSTLYGELLMENRLSALLIHLRSQTSNNSDEALTDYLNERLPPESKKFSRETIRRWVIANQAISKPNQNKLAQALGCTAKTLASYLDGNTSLDDLTKARGNNQSSQSLFEQMLQIAEQLSAIELGQALAKIGELFALRWKQLHPSANTAKKTIAYLVQQNFDACLEASEGILSAERVKAIASGAKPTLEELEILSPGLPLPFEDLELLYGEEFPNGHRDGCTNIT
jgi:hypothetical protein